MREKEERFFILDENKKVIPATLLEWGTFLQENIPQRIVKQEKIKEKLISTVFLGLDHNLNFPSSLLCKKTLKPRIFETAVFENDKVIYLSRCSTWEESLEEHAKAVKWAKDGCEDEESTVI